MATKSYIGKSNVAREIAEAYIGVDRTARKVKKIYVGVNGVARLCWTNNNLVKWTGFNAISYQYRQVNCMCYGGGKFVAPITTMPIVAYSTDGINWAEATFPSSDAYIYDVCYGNNKFLVLANNGVYYSTDGINWNKVSDGYFAIIGGSSLCYGNGKFVVYSYSNNPHIAVSTDGVNAYGQSDNLSSIMPMPPILCYGNNKFVGVGGSDYYEGTNKAIYSSNGTSWYQATLPIAKTWSTLCYGGGKFVAISLYGDVVYSSNGINWYRAASLPSLIGSGRWRSVCYGNGKFVAISNTNVYAYSTNGINWVTSIMPSYDAYQCVCYGNNRFVAMVEQGARIAYLDQ